MILRILRPLRWVPYGVWVLLALTQALLVPRTARHPVEQDYPRLNIFEQSSRNTELVCVFLFLPLCTAMAVWRWRVGPPPKVVPPAARNLPIR